MEREFKQATLKVMDNGKLIKLLTFELRWQGYQTLLGEIRKLVDIPDGLAFKTLSEKWVNVNLLGFEISLTKYSHWGSKHIFRRVMLKPRIDEDHATSSTINLVDIRTKVAELMPDLAEENERRQRDNDNRKTQDERRKAFAPLLSHLAEQHGWECKVSDPVYQKEDVKISRQIDIGKITIENGYGDVKISITLKDYSPTTIEKLVHFLSK